MAVSPGTGPGGPASANPLAQARFLMSAAKFQQLPADAVPEVAMVGRSNAGKSSALNVICQQKQLARVSKTPGRTQLINLFEIPAGGRGAATAPGKAQASDTGGAILGRLVDLPGYGFAQVPEEVRRNWGALVGGYVQKRDSLRGLVVVMDIRHPLTDLDRQMLGWCTAHGIAGHVLLTKADKLGHGAAKSTLLKVRAELKQLDPEMTVQIFSAQTQSGAEEARAVICAWLEVPGAVAGPD
jgi:GTP-binding protein